MGCSDVLLAMFETWLQARTGTRGMRGGMGGRQGLVQVGASKVSAPAWGRGVVRQAEPSSLAK